MMSIFDISHRVCGEVNGTNEMNDIKSWLEENVGQFLGRGEKSVGVEKLVLYIGAGWEISQYYIDYDNRVEGGDYKVGYYSTWTVDITDEDQSVVFGLRWL